MISSDWIGVDFDHTLAYPDWGVWRDPAPIPKAVEVVRKWIADGKNVRIFTPRIYPLNRTILPGEKREAHGTYLDNSREDMAWHSVEAIRQFCSQNFGVVLPITNVVDAEAKILYGFRHEHELPATR